MSKNAVSGSLSNGRVFYFDALRAVACLAVVMIHATALLAVETAGTPNFWVAHVLNSVSRFCVPVFVMLSGALMLDARYVFSVKKQIKHIVRIVVFFFFWSAVYEVFYIAVSHCRHETLDLKDIIKGFLVGPHHFWYCIMIAGFYLIVPLLRLWVKRENKRQIEYFLVLSLLFAFLLPTMIGWGSRYIGALGLLNIWFSRLHIDYVGGYTAYFLLGWYLHNFEIKKTRLLYASGLACLAFIIVMTYVTSVRIREANTDLYDYLTVHVFIYSASVFVFFKNRLLGHTNSDNSIWTKFFLCFSATSFGIYAMHDGIIKLICCFLEPFGWFRYAWFQIPITFFGSVLISFVLASIFRKVPFLKKVV